MNFDEFKERFIDEVKEIMEEDYLINVSPVKKNNETELTGLSARKPDSNIAPTIYLEQLYADYLKGTTFESIVEETVRVLTDGQVSFDINLEMLDSYDYVKDKLMLKLINYERNEAFLKKVPYKPFLDLAIVFYIMVGNSKYGDGSIIVNNDIYKEWNVEMEKMYADALQNTKSSLGIYIKDIWSVLKDILQKSGREDENRAMEEEYGGLTETNMYVVTNNYYCMGASVLLYDDVFKSLSESCDGDLYVIPSSIHELVVLPATGERDDSEGLLKMIKEVNDTSVPGGEILSDNLYFYDRELNRFRCLQAS